jgi:hypothetical protein
MQEVSSFLRWIWKRIRSHAALLSDVCTPRSDGSWLAFGHNNSGELGLSDTEDRGTPTAVTALGTGIVESCSVGGARTICKK